MDKASNALVHRRYFDAERLASEALQAAHEGGDFERMARICLPLQEARRQKRDLAIDSGRVIVVDGELPKPAKLTAGCYLVRPPRVGLDGRMLREMADRREVPAVIIVREPTTRAGLWPIVALGPVTVRTQVAPPPARPARKRPAPAITAPAQPAPEPVPGPTWFLSANEHLGDAAIASIDPARSPLARVEDLLVRLQAVPDHEKLHQALMHACEEAARLPEVERRQRLDETLDRLDAEADEQPSGDDDIV